MKDLNKNKILFAATAALLVAAAFTSTNAKEGSSDNSKSVAWYVANIKEAKAQNQQCHDNPNLQATADCQNSLHALQISFVGGN